MVNENDYNFIDAENKEIDTISNIHAVSNNSAKLTELSFPMDLMANTNENFDPAFGNEKDGLVSNENIRGNSSMQSLNSTINSEGSQSLQSTKTYDIPRLAYVYAVPLTHRMEDGSIVEPDILDTQRELQMIRKALKDSRKEILFRAEVATVTNFRTLVTLGCRMLHYTGHGIPNALLFENDRGQSNALSVKLLSELFKAGGVRTQVSFIKHIFLCLFTYINRKVYIFFYEINIHINILIIY